ncbi:MAG: hypothetical protein U1E56_01160 [Bauldia sp.]
MSGLTRRGLIGAGIATLAPALLSPAFLSRGGLAAPSDLSAEFSPADAPPRAFHARLQPAPPRQLFGESLDRADSNSPVLRDGERTLAFVSSFQPIGQTYRRQGPGSGFLGLGPMQPVEIVDPHAEGRWDDGKWIESVWRHPGGRLYGWYHAEISVPTSRAVPKIGALASDDDGLTWRMLGDLFDVSPEDADSDFQNGYFLGGLGDFCALVSRADGHVYIYATAYGPGEDRQGIVAARYPLSSLDNPRDGLEIWQGAWGWRAADGERPHPTPILRPSREWRHADPDAFWGPAIHFNTSLRAYVMLVNRTAAGFGDWRQDGIYVSFNERLDDPLGWSPPQRLVAGGAWYPQVVGIGPGEGDTLAGATARFFLAGYSAWEIVFSEADGAAEWPASLEMDRDLNVVRAQVSERRSDGAVGTPAAKKSRHR